MRTRPSLLPHPRSLLAVLLLSAPGWTQVTSRHSLDAGGAQGDGHSFGPSVSADGRYVVFFSRATNLVAGDTNGCEDVFVRDRSNGTIERVSVDSGGAQGNDASVDPLISPDGRYVAFESSATNLVAGATNAAADVFLRDRLAGTTERESVAAAGGQGEDLGGRGIITAHGR